MQNLLDELRTEKDQKKLEKWCDRFERQMGRLEEGQQNFYLLLLSEVFAVRLRNLGKAYECLKRVQLANDLIIYEHRLRLCYFRFLEGDYDEAINDLNIIKLTIESSLHSRKIALHFFKRIAEKQQGDLLDEERSESRENKIEDYEFQLIRALKHQRNANFEAAKRLHTAIYNNFGDLSPSIKYEAAKHLISLQRKMKGKLANERQYEGVVGEFEKDLPNKDYYFQKIQYLELIIEILQEQEADEAPINHKIIKNFVIDTIDKHLNTTKDNAVRSKLLQLKSQLQQENQFNQQVCYNFLGDKLYKQLLRKTKDQKVSKISKPKQSTIKSHRQEEIEAVNPKLKETESIEREVDSEFSGSYMTKINMNSGGYEERYFYIKKDFPKTKKLFYCSKKDKADDDNDYYRLKGFRKIQFGKKSKAFQRQQCDDFEEEHCFTLKIDGEEVYQRNFYVKEEEDLNNWLALFQGLMEEKGPSNIKKTLIL